MGSISDEQMRWDEHTASHEQRMRELQATEQELRKLLAEARNTIIACKNAASEVLMWTVANSDASHATATRAVRAVCDEVVALRKQVQDLKNERGVP